MAGETLIQNELTHLSEIQKIKERKVGEAEGIIKVGKVLNVSAYLLLLSILGVLSYFSGPVPFWLYAVIMKIELTGTSAGMALALAGFIANMIGSSRLKKSKKLGE